MSVSWGSKDASEVRNYTYSWLGQLKGAEIASATLAVESGTVTLSNIANTTDAISVTVSGGKNCETATIVSTIVTNDAEPQTLQEFFTLSIKPAYLSNAGPSTNTKRQIVSMAYEECALSGYEFDVTPEELFSGLRSLDAAMAADKAQSIDLGYNAPELFGQGDLEDYSGIPDAAVEYASLRLAQAICSKMSKVLSASAIARLSTARSIVSAMTAKRLEMGWGRSTPAGAGNRYGYSYGFGYPFMPTRRPPCQS